MKRECRLSMCTPKPSAANTRNPPEQLDALDAAMGHPTTDPHGDPIPTSDGEMARQLSKSVIEWPLKTPAPHRSSRR